MISDHAMTTRYRPRFLTIKQPSQPGLRVCLLNKEDVLLQLWLSHRGASICLTLDEARKLAAVLLDVSSQHSPLPAS